MIGDTSHDLEMARAAGVDAVAVTYGAHPRSTARVRPRLDASATSELERWLSGERLICASAALADAGRGVRFEVEYFGEPAPAFVVRYAGAVHGYLNRCAHVAMELDWQEGVFFDSDGRDLLCSTTVRPTTRASGRCVGGPCNGARW
jgi:nitrite reductase/ring-hydroxylating ferredoxin subunit